MAEPEEPVERITNGAEEADTMPAIKQPETQSQSQEHDEGDIVGKETSDIDDDEQVGKKKKKRRHRELILDEEDYELLEDNTGIRLARPQGHRRLKKARDVDRGGQLTAAEQLKEQLFGLDDDEGLEDEIDVVDKAPSFRARDDLSRAQVRSGEGDDEFVEDDEDDWLVHEFEEEQEGAATGAPRRRRVVVGEDLAGIDPAALEEANEIFGDIEDLLETYRLKGRTGAAFEDGEDLDVDRERLSDEEELAGEGSEDDLADEEASARKRQVKDKSRRQQAIMRKLQEHLEPGAVERHFMLPKDERIRDEDVPERMQIRPFNMPTSADLDECASWVWEHLIGPHGAVGKAKNALEEGAREVEGPPPAWMGTDVWPKDAMRNGFIETASHRGLYSGRLQDEVVAWMENSAAQDDLRDSIKAAIELFWEAKEEVPLVGMFRKERLGELLCVRKADEPADDNSVDGGAVSAAQRRARRWDVLWAVHRLTHQWCTLQRRKEARQRSMQRAFGSSECDPAVLASLSDMLNEARSLQEIDDVDAKFRLLVSPPEGKEIDALAGLDLGGDDGPRRRRGHAVGYHMSVKAGLRDVAGALGISSSQFADNIQVGYKRHEPLDPSMSPTEFTSRFVDREHALKRDPGAVLRSATLLASSEVASEPVLRRYVRDIFWQNALVVTKPTEVGETTLTAFHPLCIAKRLKKPLIRFEGTDTFLRVLEAEKSGYITVKFALQEKAPDPAKEVQDLYLSDGVTPEAQAWNEVRRQVLRDAVADIQGNLQREATARLTSEARAVALQNLSDRLWSIAMRAPLPLLTVDEEEEVTEKRIMAVCHGRGVPATTAVLIDSSGALVDYIHLPQLSGVIPRPKIVAHQTYDLFSDPKKATDAAALRQFIEAHLPHVIMVGVSSAQGLSLREDIQAVIDQILYDNPRVMVSTETGGTVQVGADESIAAAWENSAPAKEELPTSATIIRRAVALARQALDPLAVLASLCGPTKEVLSLALHPLQGVLPEEDKLRVVDEVMCSVTAQVGVDVNAAVAHSWLAAPLAFVPGLGPRKAASLLRSLGRTGGSLESRMQLRGKEGSSQQGTLLGDCVFRNAAPYLRVRASTKATVNTEFDPLDDTRVHPESRGLAIAMAQSAVPQASAEVAVESAMSQPQEVEDLDLAVYDAHLMEEDNAREGEPEEGSGPETRRGRSRLSTLIDIRMELVAPYGELRPPTKLPDDEELFWLAVGEDEKTLAEGRKVQAKVRYVTEELVRCVIPELNGIEATISREDVRTNAGQDEVNCRDYFKTGDSVTAAVKALVASRRSLELATSSAALNNDLRWESAYISPQDKDYYVPDRAELDQAEVARRHRTARAAFVRRPIRHPLFKNVSMVDAAAALINEPVGSAVVRPHAKSGRGLHLTMRLPAQKIWHMAVKERGRSTGDLRLATPLSMEPIDGKSAEYDDLDELEARFIDPVAANLRTLATHRKWRGEGPGGVGNSWVEIQQILQQERASAPQIAAYCLAADDTRAGAFYIGFLVGSKPRREYFAVLPDGFYFDRKMFPSIDAMVHAFKTKLMSMVARPVAYPEHPPALYAPTQPAYAHPQPYPSMPYANSNAPAAAGPGWYGGGFPYAPTQGHQPYPGQYPAYR